MLSILEVYSIATGDVREVMRTNAISRRQTGTLMAQRCWLMARGIYFAYHLPILA